MKEGCSMKILLTFNLNRYIVKIKNEVPAGIVNVEVAIVG